MWVCWVKEGKCGGGRAWSCGRVGKAARNSPVEPYLKNTGACHPYLYLFIYTYNYTDIYRA